MKIIIGIVSTLVIGFICYCILILPFVGWHYQTTQGEHTGYITATETDGLLFKTHTVYLKTDTQSNQEDAYCVVDDSVFNQLEVAATSKERITVKFIDWFSRGISKCGGESGGVIVGIK